MSWIDDAANRAIQEDKDRLRREQGYEGQIRDLWGGLVNQVREDIEAINQNQDLVTRRLGGEKLRFEQTDSGFDVIKVIYTAMYVRVRKRDWYIDIEVETAKNGKVSHRIHIKVNQNHNLYFSGEEPLTFADLSYSLLRPLLNN